MCRKQENSKKTKICPSRLCMAQAQARGPLRLLRLMFTNGFSAAVAAAAEAEAAAPEAEAAAAEEAAAIASDISIFFEPTAGSDMSYSGSI